MIDTSFVICIAVAPALLAWWTGRRLATLGDDPALPELLLARQQRLAKVGIGAMIVMVLLAGTSARWGLPVLGVGMLAAARPLRRALFEERLGMASYLAWTLLAFVGSLSFWIVLAWAPEIVRVAPERWYLASAATLAALLALWQRHLGATWLWSHRAIPFERPELLPRLEAVIRKSGVPMPRLYVFGAPGLHLVNAVALPALGGRAAVGFSRLLLDRLTPEETTAIFAHEVAHLEEFTPALLRRGRLAAWALILACCGVPLYGPPLLRELTPFLEMLLPVIVLFALGRRAARSQASETASDRRAVELTGDADALARALTKLHVEARLPRRWPHEMEASASHPSLARRIRDIRAMARTPDDATPPAASADADASADVPRASGAVAVLPAFLPSPEPGVWIAFTADRAFWFEEVPEGTPADLAALQQRSGRCRARGYADLVELRVTASGATRAIFARERDGHTWRTPIAPSHVAAAQAALDAVDHQLGHPAADAWPSIARAVALIALLPIAWRNAWVAAVLLPLLATLYRPTRTSVAAVGAAALATALALVAIPAASPSGLETLAWLVGGGAMLALAWRRAPARDAAASRLPLLALVPLGLLVLWDARLAGVVARDGLASLAALPQGVSLGAALVAAGAGLLVLARQAARAAGLLVVATGIALLVLVLGGARLASRAIAWDDATLVRVGSSTHPATAWRMVTSPGGTRAAVQRPVNRGVAVADAVADGWDWEVGSVVAATPSDRRTVRALSVAFLDDAHLLTIIRRGNSLAVRMEPAFSGEDPLPGWEARIPAMLNPVVRLDRGAGRWSVVGRPRPLAPQRGAAPTEAFALDGEDDGAAAAPLPEDEGTNPADLAIARFAAMRDTLVWASGSVGDSVVDVRRWIVPGFSQPLLPLPGGGLLYGTMRTPWDAGSPFASARLLLGGLGTMRWEVWRIGPDGARTRLGVVGDAPTCGMPDGRGLVLCVMGGSERLVAWMLDREGNRVAETTLRSSRSAALPSAEGTRAAITDARDALAVLDLEAGRGLRAPAGLAWRLRDVRPVPGGLVTLATEGNQSLLTRWRLVPRQAPR